MVSGEKTSKDLSQGQRLSNPPYFCFSKHSDFWAQQQTPSLHNYRKSRAKILLQGAAIVQLSHDSEFAVIVLTSATAGGPCHIWLADVFHLAHTLFQKKKKKKQFTFKAWILHDKIRLFRFCWENRSSDKLWVHITMYPQPPGHKWTSPLRETPALQDPWVMLNASVFSYTSHSSWTPLSLADLEFCTPDWKQSLTVFQLGHYFFLNWIRWSIILII